jgi:hypothetical protein
MTTERRSHQTSSSASSGSSTGNESNNNQKQMQMQKGTQKSAGCLRLHCALLLLLLVLAAAAFDSVVGRADAVSTWVFAACKWFWDKFFGIFCCWHFLLAFWHFFAVGIFGIFSPLALLPLEQREKKPIERMNSGAKDGKTWLLAKGASKVAQTCGQFESGTNTCRGCCPPVWHSNAKMPHDELPRHFQKFGFGSLPRRFSQCGGGNSRKTNYCLSNEQTIHKLPLPIHINRAPV